MFDSDGLRHVLHLAACASVWLREVGRDETVSGRSGTVVACLTEERAVVLITIATETTYRLGHWLHTLTAVPRSTQPSNLRETDISLWSE